MTRPSTTSPRRRGRPGPAERMPRAGRAGIAAVLAVALLAFVLAPRGAVDDAAGALAVAGTCNFPDATLLLRDAPCNSNPFGQ